jgi:hypothetical protein
MKRLPSLVVLLVLSGLMNIQRADADPIDSVYVGYLDANHIAVLQVDSTALKNAFKAAAEAVRPNWTFTFTSVIFTNHRRNDSDFVELSANGTRDSQMVVRSIYYQIDIGYNTSRNELFVSKPWSLNQACVSEEGCNHCICEGMVVFVPGPADLVFARCNGRCNCWQPEIPPPECIEWYSIRDVLRTFTRIWVDSFE